MIQLTNKDMKTLKSLKDKPFKKESETNKETGNFDKRWLIHFATEGNSPALKHAAPIYHFELSDIQS